MPSQLTSKRRSDSPTRIALMVTLPCRVCFIELLAKLTRIIKSQLASV